MDGVTATVYRLEKNAITLELLFAVYFQEMNLGLWIGLLLTLTEKCTYSEFFWSVFSRIRTEYGEIKSIAPYSVRMRENIDQKNSEYGHFSRRVKK